jgi:CubicO group peptidase (beta-lactamase class C family)
METANQQPRQPRAIHIDLKARETAWEIAPERSRMVRILGPDRRSPGRAGTIVKASTSPSATPEPRGHHEQSVLRDLPRAYYHHFWWGRRHDDGRHDFAARGNLGQVVYVSPANDVVVVRHGWRYGIEPAQWSARALRIADQLAKNPG